MTKITTEQLYNWFVHHPPSGDHAERHAAIRDLGFELASVIVTLCPPCADTTAAVRKVREAVMTANAAIACGGQ